MSEPLGQQKLLLPISAAIVRGIDPNPKIPLTAVEFLSMYTMGTDITLRPSPFPDFLEVVYNAGQNHKPIHVHEIQIASRVWMDAQIKKRTCRKN